MSQPFARLDQRQSHLIISRGGVERLHVHRAGAIVTHCRCVDDQITALDVFLNGAACAKPDERFRADAQKLLDRDRCGRPAHARRRDRDRSASGDARERAVLTVACHEMTLIPGGGDQVCPPRIARQQDRRRHVAGLALNVILYAVHLRRVCVGFPVADHDLRAPFFFLMRTIERNIRI